MAEASTPISLFSEDFDINSFLADVNDWSKPLNTNFTLPTPALSITGDDGSASQSYSGTLSASRSYEGLDRAAKALADSQFRKAIGSLDFLNSDIDKRSMQRLASLSGMFDAAMGDNQKMVDSHRGRVNSDFDKQSANVGSHSKNTGLYDEGIKENMRGGVERNRNEALADLDESMKREMISLKLQKALGLDKAEADRIVSGETIGLATAEMMAKMASTLPKYSKSESSSNSNSISESISKNTTGGGGGGGGGGISAIGRGSALSSPSSQLGFAGLGTRVYDPSTGFTRIVGGNAGGFGAPSAGSIARR